MTRPCGRRGWQATGSLEDELVRQGVVGSEIDTRALTRHLRPRGVRVGLFSGPAAAAGPEALVERVRRSPQMAGSALAAEVSTTSAYVVPAVGGGAMSSPPPTSGSRR